MSIFDRDDLHHEACRLAYKSGVIGDNDKKVFVANEDGVNTVKCVITRSKSVQSESFKGNTWTMECSTHELLWNYHLEGWFRVQLVLVCLASGIVQTVLMDPKAGEVRLERMELPSQPVFWKVHPLKLTRTYYAKMEEAERRALCK